MRHPIWAILTVCLLLGGCDTLTALPIQVTPISVAQAYEAARVGCNRGHISQIDPPSLVEAHLIGSRQAQFLLTCPNAGCAVIPITPEPGEALVWWVSLEGRWQLVGGPLPIVTPAPTGYPPMPTSTPSYFHHCQTIVNATTGVSESEQLFGP